MFEKVNPEHPDKVADRIAGALVDLAYKQQDCPKVAIEVLIGHGHCTIIAESSYKFKAVEVGEIVERIAKTKNMTIDLLVVPQDEHLAKNQEDEIKCGDNGIFKGMPITHEQRTLTHLAQEIYAEFGSDGKYVMNGSSLIICQSGDNGSLRERHPLATVNPLGDWTGGISVDSGATNRKLGSDMGDGVTGGGLHGKDLSKADVSANIWCHLKAQEYGRPITAWCAIGDRFLNTDLGPVPYAEVVNTARDYIQKFKHGFESFAEWGLID